MLGLNNHDLTVLLVLSLWTGVWKYLALWRAGTNHDKKWFIAFCIINTLGLLEIIYLYFLPSGQPKKHKLPEKNGD